ncbi:MAG: hypothetical protein R2865_05565 [Deinococcales bacterium]
MISSAIFILTIMTSLWFLVSCSVIPPIEVPISLAPTRGTISVIDAATGAQLEGVKTSVKIRAYGQGNNVVSVLLSYPPLDGNFRVFETQTGLVGFGLDKTEASSNNPVDFLVKVEAPGYLSASKTFTLRQLLNPAVTVVLIKLDAAPQGVYPVSNHALQTDSSGLTQQAISIKTPTPSGPEPALELRIPARIRLLDGRNQSVQGPIYTEMALFNTLRENAINLFPNGLDAVKVGEGQQRLGNFITAGFFAIDMRNGAGQEVHQFSQPITITVDIDARTVNPETGLAIKSGEMIPIWSYSHNTGQWRYEVDGLISGPQVGGKFKVTFQAAHLSYWNLAWFSEDICSSSRRINIIGNPNGVALSFKLYRLYANATQYWRSNFSANSVLHLASAPKTNPYAWKFI